MSEQPVVVNNTTVVAHRRTIITAGITAAATLIVTLGLTYMFTTFGAGMDAADEVHIKRVVTTMLLTDSGKTHAQVLSEINLQLATIVTKVDRNGADIQNLTGAVAALAAEN